MPVGVKMSDAKRGDSFKNHITWGDGDNRPPTPLKTMMGKRCLKKHGPKEAILVLR